MKIGIDISQIVYGTGVSVYTKNLVENLLKIDKQSLAGSAGKENEYVLFAGTFRRRKDILDVFPQAKVFPIPPTLADIIWNRLHLLPIEKLIGQVDVFHSSDWTQPPTKAFKVTTVHDLIPLKFPKLTHPKIYWTHKRRLAWVKKEADRVIVPSLTTKQDLVLYGVSEKRIRVIAEAPQHSKVCQEETEQVKKKYKIFSDYLLSVGISPTKNTANIIKAFHLAKADKNLKLVLVGRPVGMEVKEERDVRILGQVEDRELSALYSGASALIFPSLYEGFGIPILDAFNCRTPVVTSNLGSLAEVAGEAAVLVDPYEVESIVGGIKTALNQPKTLIAKGLSRVKQFSWTKAAEETLKVYKEFSG